MTRRPWKESAILLIGITPMTSKLLHGILETGVGEVSILDWNTVDYYDIMNGMFGKRDYGKPRSEIFKRRMKVGKTQIFSDKSRTRELVRSSDLVVYFSYTPSLLEHNFVNGICLENRKPWVSARIINDTVEIGPFVLPFKSACFKCYEHRVKSNLGKWYFMHEKTDYSAVQVLEDDVAAILMSEISSFFSGQPPETLNGVMSIGVHDSRIVTDAVLRAPNCFHCNKKTLPRLSTDFTREEVGVGEAVERLQKIVNAKTGIISDVRRANTFEDYPPIIILGSRVCDTAFFSQSRLHDRSNATGCSLTREKATVKLLGETVERYSMGIYDKEDLVKGSFASLKDAVRPERFCAFSKRQMRERRIAVGDKTEFRWKAAYSLTSKRHCLIPAQAVYVNYDAENEPQLLAQISTGCAAGSSLSAAILRGIYEVVERDAFMITYLNKLRRREVDFKTFPDDYLQKLTRLLGDYSFDVRVFEVTTDIPIHSFVAVIMDKTGFKKPPFCVGIKSSLSPLEALIGAVEEAFVSFPGLRRVLDGIEDLDSEIEKVLRGKSERDVFSRRALLWAKPETMKELDFLLKGATKVNLEELPDNSTGRSSDDLKRVVEIFRERKMDIYYTDITASDVRELGFFVAKVVIPGMQPVYLEEEDKCLGCDRLFEVPKILGFIARRTTEDELNKIPHPFL